MIALCRFEKCFYYETDKEEEYKPRNRKVIIWIWI